jgi:hypothetical protein
MPQSPSWFMTTTSKVRPNKRKESDLMTEDQINANLKANYEVDFEGWNSADWHGVFAHRHN